MARNIDRSREIRLWSKLIMKILSCFITILIFFPSARQWFEMKLEEMKLSTELKLAELKKKKEELQ